MLRKLQYISQGASPDEHLKNIHSVLEAGVRLIQLRLKNVDKAEYTEYGIKTKNLCKSYKSQLIINDHPEVAGACHADAVHLGLDDMGVDEARKHLARTIIGGTANTFEHVKLRCSEKVHYIGLGPYRFTTTKEKLSPVLGTEGYASIIKQMRAENLRTPIYAVGGITLSDVKEIMSTGVYGIAVSGLLTHAENKKQTVEELNKILYYAQYSR
ncbi:MAG: thiamine-phosphate pyrophosphorylase [Bacteroidetes bacterium]|nr:thiamine-phosphate pyrophosphorylase [Bacteroidota bacterium]